MLGWHSLSLYDHGTSWGYHGDDGKKFHREFQTILYEEDDGRGIPYGPTYGKGDVIGCCVDFTQKNAFFTKNGQHLGLCQVL